MNISNIRTQRVFFKCFLSSYFPTHKIIFSGQLCEAIRRAVSVEWMRVLNYGKCYYGNCIDQLYFSERKLVLPGKNVAENTFLLFQASTSKENVNYLMIHQIQTRGKEIIQLISIISDANLQLGEMVALFFGLELENIIHNYI